MIPQYSEGFPGIQVDETEKKIWVEMNDDLMTPMGEFYEKVVAEDTDSFQISDDYAAGFAAFMKSREGQDKLPLVKGQITGAFTFGLGLNDQNMKAVWFDPQYKDVVMKGLIMKAYWMIRELQKVAEKVVIFFDEPIFSALGTPAYMSIKDEDITEVLNEIADAIHSIARTKLDMIAFDAYEFGEKVTLYPDDVIAFLNRGGILAWGLIPTISIGEDAQIMKESEKTLNTRFQELQKVFADKNFPEDKLMEQMFFTPSCGMGSIIPNAAERVLQLITQIKK
jgi:hypothetical protein